MDTPSAQPPRPASALGDRSPVASPSRRGRRLRRRVLVLGFVALMVCASVFTAVADPSPSPAPAPEPTTSATPSPIPTPSGTASPCPAADCIPQPSTSPSPVPSTSAMPPAAVPDAGGGGGISGWIAKGINSAITGFFKTIVKSALNPLLGLLSDTLLTTPDPASLPRVGQLWNNSWQTALACYVLLVALAGIVVMSHETVQTRHSAKEIAPRIPLAFLAAGLSLFLAGKAVDLANALSRAALSGGADAGTAGPALRDFVLASFNSGEGSVFLILMWLAVVVVLVALLMTFVVRVALTIILVAGAPLALICHVLPQTDAVARWWWRAFGGVLAIQVAQSLALITGVRVFLTPGGFGRDGLFGLNDNGLVNVLVTLALLYIVFKIPFWILGSVRLSNGHSLAGSVARAYVMYKTFGFLHGRHTAVAGTARRNPPPGRAGWASRSARPPSPRPSGPPPRRLAPPGPPLFLPPRAPYPGPSAPTGHAAGPPPMPTFQAPGPATPAVPSPRPLFPPGLPTFQAPGTTTPTPAARRAGRAPVPTRPLFQPPTPQPHTPPRRTTRPPAPAGFQPPVPPPPPPRPARTNPPPSTTFVAPPPPRAYRTRGGDTP